MTCNSDFTLGWFYFATWAGRFDRTRTAHHHPHLRCATRAVRRLFTPAPPYLVNGDYPARSAGIHTCCDRYCRGPYLLPLRSTDALPPANALPAYTTYFAALPFMLNVLHGYTAYDKYPHLDGWFGYLILPRMNNFAVTTCGWALPWTDRWTPWYILFHTVFLEPLAVINCGSPYGRPVVPHWPVVWNYSRAIQARLTSQVWMSIYQFRWRGCSPTVVPVWSSRYRLHGGDCAPKILMGRYSDNYTGCGCEPGERFRGRFPPTGRYLPDSLRTFCGCRTARPWNPHCRLIQPHQRTCWAHSFGPHTPIPTTHTHLGILICSLIWYSSVTHVSRRLEQTLPWGPFG